MDSSNDASGDRQRGPFIGRPMPRFEDLRLVREGGRYTDDISVPGEAFAAFVRAPHAHAEITGIDSAAAHACPGPKEGQQRGGRHFPDRRRGCAPDPLLWHDPGGCRTFFLIGA